MKKLLDRIRNSSSAEWQRTMTHIYGIFVVVYVAMAVTNFLRGELVSGWVYVGLVFLWILMTVWSLLTEKQIKLTEERRKRTEGFDEYRLKYSKLDVEMALRAYDRMVSEKLEEIQRRKDLMTYDTEEDS